jgi:hypothetical protein
MPINIDNIPDLGHDPLRYCLSHNLISQDGLWMEFGVWKGQTIDLISQHTKNTVYGFDTFAGVDAPWGGTASGSMQEFNIGGKPPSEVIPIDPLVRYGKNIGEKRPFFKNVSFIKGLFEDTLPAFIEQQSKDITLLHIDCDIYSSTKTIFKYCKQLIKPGCIVVFDELVNYKGYQNHELKAFSELLDYTQLSFKWIGMNGHVFTETQIENMGDYASLAPDRQKWIRDNVGVSVGVRII